MDKVSIRHKRIGDLVDQNNIRAYVLHYFGIRFYEYPDKTLQQICSEKELNVDQVVRELESPAANIHEDNLPLISYPLDLIMEYLKHAHFIFIKRKLPYIGGMVEDFSAHHTDYKPIERDLKLFFPMFLEDFIHHIYEEEDSLFVYIRALDKAIRGKGNPSEVYYLMEQRSLQKFAIDHEAHDDEMEGIRKITSDYKVDRNTPLHIKVIYSELMDFEKALKTHARIENEVLFPKAMELENEVRRKFQNNIRWN